MFEPKPQFAHYPSWVDGIAPVMTGSVVYEANEFAATQSFGRRRLGETNAKLRI